MQMELKSFKTALEDGTSLNPARTLGMPLIRQRTAADLDRRGSVNHNECPAAVARSLSVSGVPAVCVWHRHPAQKKGK